jgi:hypothetical protein
MSPGFAARNVRIPVPSDNAYCFRIDYDESSQRCEAVYVVAENVGDAISQWQSWWPSRQRDVKLKDPLVLIKKVEKVGLAIAPGK